MKIKEAVALASPSIPPRWQKVKCYLDGLPHDEIKLSVEVAEAVGTSKTLGEGVPKSLADYSELIFNPSGGKRRIFGNPAAIKELRKQLKTTYET